MSHQHVNNHKVCVFHPRHKQMSVASNKEKKITCFGKVFSCSAIYLHYTLNKCSILAFIVCVCDWKWNAVFGVVHVVHSESHSPRHANDEKISPIFFVWLLPCLFFFNTNRSQRLTTFLVLLSWFFFISQNQCVIKSGSYSLLRAHKWRRKKKWMEQSMFAIKFAIAWMTEWLNDNNE